jgi:hypothetical protein
MGVVAVETRTVESGKESFFQIIKNHNFWISKVEIVTSELDSVRINNHNFCKANSRLWN